MIEIGKLFNIEKSGKHILSTRMIARRWFLQWRRLDLWEEPIM